MGGDSDNRYTRKRTRVTLLEFIIDNVTEVVTLSLLK